MLQCYKVLHTTKFDEGVSSVPVHPDQARVLIGAGQLAFRYLEWVGSVWQQPGDSLRLYKELNRGDPHTLWSRHQAFGKIHATFVKKNSIKRHEGKGSPVEINILDTG